MSKRPSGSSVQGKQAAKNAAPISDDMIDFSDAPELTAEELKRAKRVGAHGLIAIRLQEDLIKKIKKLANQKKTTYQSVLCHLLTKAVRNAA